MFASIIGSRAFSQHSESAFPTITYFQRIRTVWSCQELWLWLRQALFTRAHTYDEPDVLKNLICCRFFPQVLNILTSAFCSWHNVHNFMTKTYILILMKYYLNSFVLSKPRLKLLNILSQGYPFKINYSLLESHHWES